MSHDEPRLQLHAYLKSLSGYRGAPLHVDLCFYVCNPKNVSKTVGTGPYTGRDVRVGFSGRALPSNRADFLKTLHISLYFLKTS